MTGIFIAIFGPSGSGKGDLIAHIRRNFTKIVFPVSCTTRTARPGEIDGEVYHFVSEAEFEAHKENGDFLEWASFGGARYGTLKGEVLPALEAGKVVLRELDAQGIEQIRTLIPQENLVVIFIDAGSWSDLSTRIRARAPMSDEELEKRQMRYREEKDYGASADYVVHNFEGKLEEAKQELSALVSTLAN